MAQPTKNSLEKDIQKKSPKEAEKPEPEKKEVKLLSSPKSVPEKEAKEVGIFADLQRQVSIWEKEISARTFYISQILLLAFGLVVIFGMAFVLNDNKLFPSGTQLVDYNPVTKNPTIFNLELNNPEDGFLSSENTISVSGKTGPKAEVVISGSSQDYIIEANSRGEFSKVVNLDPGLNELNISAFDVEGNAKNEKINVYYSEVAL